MNTANHKLNMRRGFTLIELLVVIALTAILLTVVFRPLVASLDLTNRASSLMESQAAARDTDAQVNDALSLADYVLDPTLAPINLWLTDRLGNPYLLQSQFTMMEYIPSAHQLDQNPYIGAAPLPIDPTTGKPSYNYPNLTPGQTGLAFPLANGPAIGRVFIGLVHNASGPGILGTNGTPTARYFNFYEWANTAAADPNKPAGMSVTNNNTFTLYKAEVPTYIPDPDSALPQPPYVPNLMLFHTSAVSGGQPDLKTGPIIIEDPNFFYDNSLAGGNDPTAGTKKWAVPGWKDLNGDGKVEIWENWAAVSTSLVRTDKVDLMSFVRDPLTNAIVYDVNNHPTVNPLATFKPAFVQNDPAVGTNLSNSGNEVPTPIAPNFSSTYDHWASNYRVFVYRNSTGNGVDPTQNSPLEYYEGVILPASYMGTPLPNAGQFKIVHITAMGITPGMTPPDPTNPALPDVSGDVLNGVFTTTPQFSFMVSSDKGQIGFGFPSTSVIHTATNAPLPQRYSPDDINQAYLPYAGGPLGPGSRRFLTLTSLPTTTWNGSQLNPATITASPLLPIAPNTITTPSIVPGTELVFGPDQVPGVHYGCRIQYSRVSANAGFTGPNQYKINYTNNSNTPGGIINSAPSLIAGYVEFNCVPDGNNYNSGTFYGGGNGLDPNTGQPATGPNMLPIWKFDPNSGRVDGTLQSDPVEVYYNFQSNLPADVVKIDYMTRALTIFTLEMQLYDQGSGKPQVTRLTDKIKVRNLQH